MIADWGFERGHEQGRERGDIRVLHVDDEPEFSELVQTFLEREHDAISVVRADDVAAGLEVLDRRRIDCVVSDFDMPERDGLAFLEAVREREPDLPFILFTGNGSETVTSEALEAGVTDYLRKGTGREQYEILANRIDSAVDRRRTERALEESERRRETLARSIPGFVYRSVIEPTWSGVEREPGSERVLDGTMEFVSDGSEAVTGYRPDELTNGTVAFADHIHDDDRESVRTIVRDAVANRDPFDVTYRFTTREGRTRRLWERGRVVRSDEHVALEGYVTDELGDEYADRTLSRVALTLARSVSRSESRDPDGA